MAHKNQAVASKPRKDQAVASKPHKNHQAKPERARPGAARQYEAELFRLQAELVKMQEWVRDEGPGHRRVRGP